VKPSASASGSHCIICPAARRVSRHRAASIGFAARCGYASSRGVLERNRVKEISDATRICVAVEIREGYLTRRVRITAPSIERALKIAREGKLDRRVSLVFPIDPEAFFVPEGPGRREAA
jgi:hypothetical protein